MTPPNPTREQKIMSLKSEIEDMRRASLVLALVDQPKLSALLAEIANAATDTANGPTPMMERMRWTPVVTHAAAWARQVTHTAERAAVRWRER